MATRKTTKTTTTGKGASARKANKTPLGNTRAIDDNYVAPKRKPKAEKVVTLAEALAESGESMDDLRTPPEAERPTRPVGNSNLANTIRTHRKNYAVMLRGDKKTQNNGDAIAVLLLSIPLEKLKAFSATRFEGKTYDHLNPGHARMCIGNLIRGAAKKDEAILPELYAMQPKAEAESDLDNTEQADWCDTSAE